MIAFTGPVLSGPATPKTQLFTGSPSMTASRRSDSGRINAGPTADVYFGGKKTIQDPVELINGQTVSASSAMAHRKVLHELMVGSSASNRALTELRQAIVSDEDGLSKESQELLIKRKLIDSKLSLAKGLPHVLHASLEPDGEYGFEWVEHPFEATLDEVMEQVAKTLPIEDKIQLKNGAQVSKVKVEAIQATIVEMLHASESGEVGGPNSAVYRLWCKAVGPEVAGSGYEELGPEDWHNLQEYGLADKSRKISKDILAVAESCFQHQIDEDDHSSITRVEPYQWQTPLRNRLKETLVDGDIGAVDLIERLDSLGDIGVETMTVLIQMGLLGNRAAHAFDMYDRDLQSFVEAVRTYDSRLQIMAEEPEPQPRLALTAGDS